MVQLGGVELDHEAELLIFTCFAVATTYDKNNTERPYNTTECKGVIRQLIKRKDPSLLNSKSVKKMNIDWLHDRWCLQVTRPEVIAMRETVEKHKAYYLARAAELLQKCQTGPKPNQVELTLNDDAFKQPAPSNESGQSYQASGYGQYQVPGYTVSTAYGQPRTHGYTATFPSQQAPFDESVSNAVGNISLNAPSLPRLAPAYTSSYGERPGADLRNPTQQYSYTDPIRGVEQSRGTGPAFHINRDADAYYQPPLLQQSPYAQGFDPQNESRRELSQAEPDEDSIVEIGDSVFNTRYNYVGRNPRSRCRSDLSHRGIKYYGAPGRVRESSAHAIENYNAWKSQAYKKAKGEESSSKSSSSPSGGSDPPPQRRRPEDKPKPVLRIGKSYFKSSQNYLGNKAKHRCTSRGFPPCLEDDDDYGASGIRSTLGKSPSPHAVENHEAWQKQAYEALDREAAGEEASTSSGKSKSPAYHEERRERETERERRDQPVKSRGSKSGDGSKKDSKSKDDQPSKSRGSKSGSSSKKKDSSSKDDAQGGGRRRGERK